jgi:mannose-6-phosphate isomerase-like protein (cupin superfamily)
MKKINIAEKLSKFTDHWSPKIISSLNGQDVKLAKLKGDFVWHQHEEEDELFYVLKGELTMEFRDRKEIIQEGEMIMVPRGVEHRPTAQEEVHIMLFEPSVIKHTGNVQHEITVDKFEEI